MRLFSTAKPVKRSRWLWFDITTICTIAIVCFSLEVNENPAIVEYLPVILRPGFQVFGRLLSDMTGIAVAPVTTKKFPLEKDQESRKPE